MKEPNKKKITKNTIDIESEFIGKPVESKKKKEKKDDLTDEINTFLKETVTLDSIKRILLRLQGTISIHDLKNSKIFVYGISTIRFDSKISVQDYLIKINCRKNSYIYFLNWRFSYCLSHFSKTEINKSKIRTEMTREIRNWLEKNLDKISTKIGYDNILLS